VICLNAILYVENLRPSQFRSHNPMETEK
jgi:hypothetical protein